MKHYIAVLILFLSSSALAGGKGEIDIVKVTSSSQNGVNRLGSRTSECSYRLYRRATMDNLNSQYAIEIKSDLNTHIYGDIELEQQDIPLRDGLVYMKHDEEATYQDGILKYYLRQDNGPHSSYITNIEIAVSRDLKTVSSVKVYKVIHSIFGQKTDTLLNCQF